jgi:hypothetical protein
MEKSKMKHTTLLLQLAAALLFATCHKQNETIIDYTFTDANSDKPVEGLEVFLQEFDYNELFGIVSNMTTLASYKTNASGKIYTIVKNLNTKKGHSIEWQKPSECYGEDGRLIRIGQVNKYERTLSSKGFTMLYLKNVAPFNENDTVFFCNSLTREINPYCFLPNTAFVGMNINTTLPVTNGGNKKIYYHWKVIKNGISKMYFDSVTSLTCDTTKIYINY